MSHIKYIIINDDLISRIHGLTAEQVENINLQEYEAIFDEMVKEPTPKGKPKQTGNLAFQTDWIFGWACKCWSLFPLLTFVLIKCGKDINEQVKFIERFVMGMWFEWS